MKIAIAQIKSEPGQIPANTERIISTIGVARKQQIDLLVFPELSIPAYCMLDLVFNESYIEENLTALEKITEHAIGITVIVGFVEKAAGHRHGNPRLYNSAAILGDSKLVGIQRKTLLPDYDIFNESRYFLSGEERRVFEIGKKKIGVQICEDLWDEKYTVKITEELLNKEAEIIVNLSASPFHLGKINERNRLVQRYSDKDIYFILANTVGSFDGYDGEVVFDGASMAYGPGGKLLKLGKSFTEDFLVIDTEALPIEADKRASKLTEEPIEALYEALILGTKSYFDRNPFYPCVLGLSGGIDSAVVACIAADALGSKHVHALTMPSKYSSKETLEDAIILAKNLGITIVEHGIDKLFSETLNILRLDEQFAALPEDLTEENLQARIRMLLLMAYTNKLGGALLNTGNKTELALGYCTIYGDMAGSLSILGDVDKVNVYRLAAYINQKANKALIPLRTIERPASAELRENQKDSDSLGAEPEALAPLVSEFIEEFMSLAEAQKKYSQTFSPEVIKKTFQLIKASEWKRRQAPPAIRVTKKAFGIGRRWPMGL